MATYGLKSITVGSDTYEMNTKNGISINGTSWDGSASGTAIYAPTSAGTSGQVLVSNGSGAPDWGSVSGTFFAIYGTTTYEDVLAAYNAGKTIIATKADGYDYTDIRLCDGYDGEEREFYFSRSTNTTYLNWTLKYGSLWSEHNTNMSQRITLNGSALLSPSFYAPTTAGTNGYFLKSNGSGAPTWVSPPSGVFIAEYGSTSYADIVTAINNDENVIVHTDSDGYDIYGTLVDKGSSIDSISFFAVDSSIDIGIVFRVYEDDSWLRDDSYRVTDSRLALSQSQPTSSICGIIFGTGTSASSRQYDLTGKIDTGATNAGLRYQNKYLYAPGLYVGDLDLTITNTEYTTLMTSLDAI